MLGAISRPCLFIFSYVLGMTTCFILLHLFICENLRGMNSLKYLKHRIYISNELYNSRGLLKEGDTDEDYDKFEECMDIYSKYYPVDPLMEQQRELLHMNTGTKGPRKLFINCGGTFPWSVELFINTYPHAKEFQIFSFIRDTSYGVMYKKIPNHTLYLTEASVKNTTVNMDVKCFGCGYAITEKVVKVDVASWIKSNTRKSDYVIIRMEAEEEKEIVERLIDLKVFASIDKYYTTSKDQQFLEYLRNVLSNQSQYTIVQTWDVHNQTYSDFKTVNDKSIPIAGSLIDKCQDKNTTEKFALFLYSNTSSTNIHTVVNLLHQLSPKNVLPFTMFLPYQFYLSEWSNMQWLFDSFTAGLYYAPKPTNHNNSSEQSRAGELSLFNAAIATQAIFQAHLTYMQNIMYGTQVPMDEIQEAIETYNYNFFPHGVDITHLTDHVLGGGTITMDMTGWKTGKYLMINIDTPNSEYLLLYMARRFSPWLLDVFHCSTPRPSFPK